MVKKKQMLFTDFPDIGKITVEIKAKNEKRVFTGGIRIGSGKYRTDEQSRKYVESSLKRKLP